jgi:hypothetical protein
MKGSTIKIRSAVKERLLRPFYRFNEQQVLRCQAQRELITQLLAGESNDLGSSHALESFMTDLLMKSSEDANSTNADINLLME